MVNSNTTLAPNQVSNANNPSAPPVGINGHNTAQVEQSTVTTQETDGPSGSDGDSNGNAMARTNEGAIAATSVILLNQSIETVRASIRNYSTRYLQQLRHIIDQELAYRNDAAVVTTATAAPYAAFAAPGASQSTAVAMSVPQPAVAESIERQRNERPSSSSSSSSSSKCSSSDSKKSESSESSDDSSNKRQRQAQFAEVECPCWW